MKSWTVVLSVGYNVAKLRFDSIVSAGAFVETLMNGLQDGEDNVSAVIKFEDETKGDDE